MKMYLKKAIIVRRCKQCKLLQLINQLAPGGRLICPVVAIEGFQRFQDLLQVDKNTDGTITKKKLMQVSYVPLTDPTTQLRN